MKYLLKLLGLLLRLFSKKKTAIEALTETFKRINKNKQSASLPSRFSRYYGKNAYRKVPARQ